MVLGEPTAPAIRRVMQDEGVVVVSAISRVEARAGLARARRGKRLTPRREQAAWGVFEAMWATAAILDVDRTLITTATELAERHGVRGYDAVQLASALRAAEATGSPSFVCLDRELNAAAVEAGLVCVALDSSNP